MTIPTRRSVTENEGKIDLAGTALITLAGGNVRLTSDEAATTPAAASGGTPAVNMAALTITASTGNAGINAKIRTSGNLTITAGGELRLATSQDAVLNGAVITLTGANAPTGRGIGSNAITVMATGNLVLETDINTTGNVTLEAGEGATSGAINFSTTKAVTVAGNVVTLTSDAVVADVTASGQAAVIRASGNLMVSANLVAGAGTLTLEAGAGTSSTGTISFPGASTLRASAVTLIQDGARFGTSVPTNSTFQNAGAHR